MIPTFDKEVLVTIEKIIGIPFTVELYLDGSVCFANNDDVRPEFRQHFNVFHVLVVLRKNDPLYHITFCLERQMILLMPVLLTEHTCLPS